MNHLRQRYAVTSAFEGNITLHKWMMILISGSISDLKLELRSRDVERIFKRKFIL